MKLKQVRPQIENGIDVFLHRRFGISSSNHQSSALLYRHDGNALIHWNDEEQ
jgi:hypothetical protein